MNELKLEVGKKYNIKNRIFNPVELLFIVENKDSDNDLLFREPTSAVFLAGEEDIISEYTEPKKLSGWINLYEKRCPSRVCATKEDANYDNSKYCIGEKRIACIDLSQFNEGEGL